MKFPYGNADFYKIITENYVYIDRSDRIRLIENVGDTLLLLRPRRFGKSLLLSLLENYYDLAKASQFNRLFGQIAIGQNPTPKHNQYLILKWNFSLVDAQGDIADIKIALHDHLNEGLNAFRKRYQEVLAYDIEIKADNAIASFESALTAMQATPYKIYLLIDEYDNFANEVLMAGLSNSQKRYRALVEGEGMLKTVFKTIKAGMEGRGIDRLFITGVSPVINDITSGIAENISLEPEFNDLCGFWESEVAEILKQIAKECGFPVDKVVEALEMMRVFYNGYRFTHDQEGLIYNPTLALYFLEHFANRCQYPQRLLDSNLAMDKSKITYISQLLHGEQVISKALNEEKPLAIPELADRFGVKDILYAVKDTSFMVSLLYYFGVLTLTNQRTEYGELIFQIPNLVTRKLYVERIQEILLPTFEAVDEAQRVSRLLYQTGDMQPLCDFIEQKYFKVFDNRDYKWTNELTIKTVFLMLLFDDTFYIMDSETALVRDYADLTMMVRPDMRQYKLLDILIEFKYVNLGKNKLSGEQVSPMSSEALKKLAPVKNKLAESKAKLETYRKTLQSVYQNKLRLRVYSVVAVGYDRLVWVEHQSLTP
jgi:hypothetical protein